MDPMLVLKGALPPIAAALLLVSLGGARLLPLAAAIGLYVAHGLVKGWPAWPHELWTAPVGREWLLWGVSAAGLLALLEHGRALPKRSAPGLAVAVAGATVWLLLTKKANQWTSGEVLLHIGGGGVVAGLLVLASRRSLASAPAGVAPAIVWSTLLSIDAVLLTGGAAAFLGQLCGALAAAVGAAAGTTLWRRGFATTAADGTWLAVGHVGFVLAGANLEQVPWPAAGLALAAPLPLLLLERLGANTSLRWGVLGCLLAVVPASLSLLFVELPKLG